MSRMITATLALLAAVAFLLAAEPLGRAFEGAELTASGLVTITSALAAIYLFIVALKNAGQALFVDTATVCCVDPARGRATLVSPLTEKQRRLLARRAAGHTLAACMLGHTVTEASIEARSRTASRISWRHKDDVPLDLDYLTIGYAGLVAAGPSAGATTPPHGADVTSQLLHDAVALSTLDPEGRSLSELLDAAHAQARTLVTVHADALEALTQAFIDTAGERPLGEREILQVVDRHGVHAAEGTPRA